MLNFTCGLGTIVFETRSEMFLKALLASFPVWNRQNYFIIYLNHIEESRLRVFENRILRRIFGPKRDQHGEWRRLHNEELHSLYRSPNIVRVIKSKIEMGRACSQNGGR